MTEPTKKGQPQVEQWMEEAAFEFHLKHCTIGHSEIACRLRTKQDGDAEIIARHAPYSAAAVEELVRAAKSVLPMTHESYKDTVAQCRLRSALAALEGK